VKKVACLRLWFDARCKKAGKRQEDCELCVVKDNGKKLLVDASHEHYPRIGLGDRVASALSSVGITEQAIKSVTGAGDCGCKNRREALNKLGRSIGIGR
jgi:hypothetical protein